MVAIRGERRPRPAAPTRCRHGGARDRPRPRRRRPFGRGESIETATRPADEMPVHFGIPVRELVLRARVRHVVANRGGVTTRSSAARRSSSAPRAASSEEARAITAPSVQPAGGSHKSAPLRGSPRDELAQSRELANAKRPAGPEVHGAPTRERRSERDDLRRRRAAEGAGRAGTRPRTRRRRTRRTRG